MSIAFTAAASCALVSLWRFLLWFSAGCVIQKPLGIIPKEDLEPLKHSNHILLVDSFHRHRCSIETSVFLVLLSFENVLNYSEIHENANADSPSQSASKYDYSPDNPRIYISTQTSSRTERLVYVRSYEVNHRNTCKSPFQTLSIWWRLARQLWPWRPIQSL